MVVLVILGKRDIAPAFDDKSPVLEFLAAGLDLLRRPIQHQVKILDVDILDVHLFEHGNGLRARELAQRIGRDAQLELAWILRRGAEAGPGGGQRGGGSA
jgi:hypothetical protein